MHNKIMSIISILTITCFLISCATTVTVFKIEPISYNFGQVNISETAACNFLIRNKKSVDMTLTIVRFSTAEFSEITGAQGKIISPKGALTIKVQFAPVLPGGAKTDTMQFEWTDINNKTDKKDVKLSGEAVPVAKINQPTTFDFGTVGIGLSDSHNFSIENPGTASLILSVFNFNGNAMLFSITAGGSVPVMVTPGSSQTVTVRFAPSAVGSFPTTLEISHNAVNTTSPATINIAAAGGGGRIEFNQTSPWDFGQVKIAGFKTDVLEISNTGSINLNITNINLSTATNFAIDKIQNSSSNPVATPFAIAPSDYVLVTIKFSPTTIGNYNATLNMSNDGSYAASPATLNLTGTGRAPITQTLNYTGSAQQWNVPAGVNSIECECLGAEGADGHYIGTQIPGKGGSAKGEKAVTPGETLNVYVGGEGLRANNGVPAAGGWNGGGAGYDYGNTSWYCAGGGGASDVRQGGTALSNRFIVAGAGGGGGGSGSWGDGCGGNGGGTNGVDAYGGSCPYDRHGKGATQTAGGAGGSGYGIPGTAGSLGQGGNASTESNALASGGGGGYYGGGGGSYHGGGGGGGSSFIQGLGNSSTQAGVRTGNGQVTVNY